MKKDGKYFEQLVHLIETSISPNSIVEHDVQLPVHNSRIGATSQCDIVIRSGKSPRETITIIEVQDRESQVKPNDFRGWKQKLEDVGAQHLICVSRQEFPESIKEQAALSGNKIRLMTLKELTADKIPLDFFGVEFAFNNISIPNIGFSLFQLPKKDLKLLGLKEKHFLEKLQSREPIFSVNKINLSSLSRICHELADSSKEILSGKMELEFRSNKEPFLYCYIKNHFVKLDIRLKFEWKKQVIPLPIYQSCPTNKTILALWRGL